mmetsp:Transcript_40997/g.82214  ORF Transcript_40997/g.82214 Transcript_40997/m.82214 type:complete len:186 (-) Transcript_40997:41-598(-)
MLHLHAHRRDGGEAATRHRHSDPNTLRSRGSDRDRHSHHTPPDGAPSGWPNAQRGSLMQGPVRQRGSGSSPASSAVLEKADVARASARMSMPRSPSSRCAARAEPDRNPSSMLRLGVAGSSISTVEKALAVLYMLSPPPTQKMRPRESQAAPAQQRACCNGAMDVHDVADGSGSRRTTESSAFTC